MNIKLNLIIVSIFALLTLGFTCSTKSILKSVYDLRDISVEDPNKLPAVCSDVNNYAPDQYFPEHTPMKYVKVNFHVINNEKGDLAISEKDAPRFLKMMLDSANYWLAHNKRMRLPVGHTNPTLPTKIRYVLTGDPNNPSDDGIYYHYDDNMCYVNSAKNATKETNSIFSSKQYEKYGVQKEEVLNIFILEHHPDSLARKRKYKKINGVGGKHWAKLSGIKPRYERYQKTNYKNYTPETLNASYFGRFMNHEVGHSLGLSHTWKQNDGCDDTPKHNHCWNLDENDARCDEWSEISNNVMDYNAFENSYSPCQIGKIHYNILNEKASQRKITIPYWCEYNEKKSIKIKSGKNLVWDHSKDIEGDLIISNNASLKIECVLSIPRGGKIIIHESGELILGKNAHITNRCGDDWGGIEIWENGKKKGKLRIGDGATVSNVVSNKINKSAAPDNKSFKTQPGKKVLTPKKKDPTTKKKVLKKSN